VNRRNYKTLAMQAHALTSTRYFCSRNVIISHPIVYREGPGYLSVCAIASRSSPPTHVCICNGQRNLELFCVLCILERILKNLSMRVWIGFCWLRMGSSGDSCGHGSEPLYSLKGEEFLDKIKDCQFIKKDFAPLS
jgi:hypothetical protein